MALLLAGMASQTATSKLIQSRPAVSIVFPSRPVVSANSDIPAIPQAPKQALIRQLPILEHSQNTGAQPRPNKASVSNHPPASEKWLDMVIAKGDSLSVIFERLALDKRDMRALLDVGSDTATLKRLHPGESLRFRLSEGRLSELFYDPDRTRSLHVWRLGGEFVAEATVAAPVTRVVSKAGRITHSLWQDGQAAGLSRKSVAQLVEIFRWDIDFALDLRDGDRFSVVHEERYLDDRKVGDGDILAAEFVNRGRSFRAVRYDNGTGKTAYYRDTGHSLRKAFLRTPVDFVRISSHFNLNRRHPILNTIRAHRGVDYAAPKGTPVKATGDGAVSFAGRKNGYGKTVVVKHGTEYSTLYAHLSRLAKGLEPGKTVAQGDVIGYVGQTGLATGPHLHYEFRVGGKHQDPLRMELPDSLPLPAARLADFRAQTASVVSKLDDLAAQATTDLAAYVE